MSDEAVRYRLAGTTAVLELNRPASRNAIDPALQFGILAGVERATVDRAHCLVLSGGERGFCSGADLKYVARLHAEAADGSALNRMITRATEVLVALEQVPMVTISCVNGVAVGAGVGFALVTDFCLAERSARFITRFTSLGVTPDNGVSTFLVRRLGQARAAQLLLRDLPLDAAQARDLGLVDQLCEDGEGLAAALALAGEFSAVSRVSVLGTRELVASATANSLAEQVRAEAVWARRAASSDEFKARSAAFAAGSSR